MTAAAPEPALRAFFWRCVGRHLYRLSFHNWYDFRGRLLAWHGATIEPDTKFRRTVRVECPWNLEAGTLAMIGDDVELRAFAPLRIGARAVVSQLCVVTTRCRDPRDPGFKSRDAPVDIGNDAWVAADSVVLPGARIGDGAVVGARSVVEGELPAWRIATGDPAVPRRDRPWNGPRERDSRRGADEPDAARPGTASEPTA